MKIRVHSDASDLDPATESLLRRMFSPLCGLATGLGFNARDRDEPRFLMAGGELTGVHLLRGEPRPRQGSYHIGGSGVIRDEALIRSLGETAERYAQMMAVIGGRHRIATASLDDPGALRGERALDRSRLHFFTAEQLARPDFPFQPLDPAAPMGWVRLPSMLGTGPLWVPAQLVLVGYLPRVEDGERRIFPAVTTGTAAHTRRDKALRNALLELVQIDAAMGHWFTRSEAPRIRHGRRTRAVQRLIERRFGPDWPAPAFHWLPSPDLGCMTLACVVRSPDGRNPAVAVGLGSDLRLADAMYKALLEAVAVVQMAKVVSFYGAPESTERPLERDPRRMFDLDSNVAYYADPANAGVVETRFAAGDEVDANDLPPDSEDGPRGQIEAVVERFRASGKELLFADLTTPDIAELGFTAARAWSPDTLSLCLPSAPPLLHPRFEAYGGVADDLPHPYP